MNMKEQMNTIKEKAEVRNESFSEITGDELKTIVGGAMNTGDNVTDRIDVQNPGHRSSSLDKSLQKLSAGMQINSSSDNSSGYQISDRMPEKSE